MKFSVENIRFVFLMKMLSLIGTRHISVGAIQRPDRKNQRQKTRRVFKNFSIDDMQINNHQVFTFAPDNVNKNLHIIYFHGGAYIWQGVIIHWLFLRNFMRRLACRGSYIDYPLAPECGYVDTFNMVQYAYEQLVREYPDDTFVFMGDSAGAGLAFSFAQKLNKDEFPIQPKKLILISPWLDLSLENPAIEQLENQDPLLSVGALSLAADLYAKGDDKANYLLSPINGEIEGLGEIHLFVGTRDILWPDCVRFFVRSKNIHNDVYLYEYKNMPHIWLFFPFEETKDALAKIINILHE